MDSKSAGNSLQSSLECQIARIYSSKKEKFIVETVPVHQQEGSEDYGVFAIAYAVELAFGGDPRAVIYKQESMSSHLESCLCEGKLSPFPVAGVAKYLEESLQPSRCTAPANS